MSVSTRPLSTSIVPFGRFMGGRKRQLQPFGVRIVQWLWNFIGG
jgi:hypothetical protein